MKTKLSIAVTALAAIILISSFFGKDESKVATTGQEGAVLAATTNGLVGYWSLNDGSGTTAQDNSGNNSAASLVNSPSWTTGRLGGALSFNGTNSYVNTNVNSSSGALTYSAWINFNTTSGFPRVISKSGQSYVQINTSSGFVQFQHAFSTREGYWNTANNSLTSGWHHVAVTYDSSSLSNKPTIYIDGVAQTLAFSQQPQGSPVTNSNNYLIGANTSSSGFFNGILDEVRIYNRALSSSEITDVYNDAGISGGTTTPPPSTPPTSTTAPIVNNFTANPSSITSGQSATLFWDVVGSPTPTVSISNIGNVSLSSSSSVSPTQTTTYTLTATNSAGSVSRSVTVTVTVSTAGAPVINYFYPSASNIPNGGTTALNWSVSGSPTPTITITGLGTVTGTSRNVSPTATASYTLTATNSAGSASAVTTVTVGNTTPPPTNGATISVFPSQTYQTMAGWGAISYAGDDQPQYFNTMKDAIFTQIANNLNINRLIVGITSGVENKVDYWTQHENGQLTDAQFRCYHYSQVNDDSDPNTITSSGFQFSELDSNMSKVVMPFRQYVLAKGEPFYYDIGYVAFNGQMVGSGCPSGLNYFHNSNPNEYAEFVLATMKHLQSTFGVLPDSWEVINEPDNSGAYAPGMQWTPAQIANAVVAAGQKLQANGFPSKIFSVPSNVGLPFLPTWWDQMLTANPAFTQYVKEISYHTYTLPSPIHYSQLVSRAQSVGARTNMNERNQGTATMLHDDIKLGNVSSWDLGGMGGVGADLGYGYLWGTAANPANQQVSLGAQFIRQYFKYVRTGAVRIGASTGNSTFDPVAFVNKDGKYVVVVKATAGGSFSISNLPAGTYGIFYTTGDITKNGPANPPTTVSAYDVQLADQTITSGQNLSTSIPAMGIITIYSKTGGSVPPPSPDTTAPSTPANLSATAVSGTGINLSWSASTDNVGVTGYRVYRCQGAGCTPTTQIGTTVSTSYSDTSLTSGTAYVYKVAAYDAAGNISASSGSATATTQAASTPPSTAFSTGDRVQATANLNVRASASVTGTLLGTQSLGALGSILSGGTFADGFYWWNVNYDTGVDGWSVESYLNKYTAPTNTLPTITASVSPSSINSGSSATISWTVTGNPAPTVSISGGIGAVTGTSRTVSPTQTTTYTLTATNSAGSATDQVTVTVNTVTVPPPTTGGTSWYAAPNGSASGSGTINSPWDLQTALCAGVANCQGTVSISSATVKPGDTIYLRGGRYTGTANSNGTYGNYIFSSRLTGTAASPITVRSYPGERAILDGTLAGQTNKNFAVLDQRSGGGYLIFRDFDITNSDPSNRLITQTFADNSNTPIRRGNSIDIRVPGVKLINLVIYDTGQGIGGWNQAPDMEAYGNIIFNNGWDAPDRLHGHAVYSENLTGAKLYQDNFLGDNFGLTLRVGGGTSAGTSMNHTFDRNVLTIGNTVIGTNGVIDDMDFTNNYVYGANLSFGYGGTSNNNLNITGNTIMGGFTVDNFQTMTMQNNQIWAFTSQFNMLLKAVSTWSPSAYNFGNNTYYTSPNFISQFYINNSNTSNPTTYVGPYSAAKWQALGLDTNSTFNTGAPTFSKIAVHQNKYDPNMANVVIYNFPKNSSVNVDISSLGWPSGSTYELRNTQDYFGDVLTGTYNGSGSITVPMTGHTVAAPLGYSPTMSWYHYTLSQSTFPEFGAFRLIKTSGGTPNPTPGDTTAPTTPTNLRATASSPSQIDLAWNASTDNVGIAGYRIFRCQGVGCTPTTRVSTVTSGTSYSDNGLLAGITYVYAVGAVDAAGNISANSSTANATTASVGDTTPPLISAMSSSQISTTGATISWSTNEVADSQVEYGLTTAYGQSTVINNSLVTSHVVSISGLTPGTTYNFRVKSRDAAGNLSTSVNQTFTTGSVAPSVPVISSFTATPNSITSGNSSTLAWSVTGATSLSLNQNIGTVTGTSRVVSPTQTTTYTLTATNSTGSVSSNITVTVTAAQDTTQPTVSVTSPLANSTVTNTITLSANATDNVGVTGVQFRVDGTNVGLEDTTSPYSISLDTKTLTNASHMITAIARDAAGNTGVSSGVSVTVNNVGTPKKPRKIRAATTSLEGISTLTTYPTATVDVVSPTTKTILSTQTLTADAQGEYTVNFAASDPQIVDLRVRISNYLPKIITNIDTTVDPGVATLIPTLLAGDFNNDGVVNSLDYSLMSRKWNQSATSLDINRDGVVNSLDYAILTKNWGKRGE